MANTKGSSNIKNTIHNGKHSLLPPKSPFPSICPSYVDYIRSPAFGPKGIAKPRELNSHHQRTSSESFLMDEQPSWLDELLDEPDTPVRKGGHRRSSSDSFAYIDVANASTMDYASQDDYRLKKYDLCAFMGKQMGFHLRLLKSRIQLNVVHMIQRLLLRGRIISPAKSSASESDTKRAKQYVLSFVLPLSILSLLACMS
ncbi:Basic-leucine zipper (bZIP) transcription factor family protein [Actinidia rufa]|uniref:Basic-leucine zipper (BZIP) transcription factor family protein n=1 Tax=Actinidia rufa TaxID=165716 RepID=A0A7J0F7P0_9ERIC|nr:Basic-leucine zipper (bZIP) transcription factor family protein [Actinidia rufa]